MDADTEPLVHKERLTEQGWPTGYALCDAGDGTEGGPVLQCVRCATADPRTPFAHRKLDGCEI